MKSLLLFLAIFAFFSFLPQGVYAQGMMGGFTNPSPADSTTAKDEAAGKAVWDKLQNKQVRCSQLTDDDFDVLGDFFMGNMMGSNHDSMNQLMAQRLGDNGEKQMHIAMGKRLSGCQTNATFPKGAGYFSPMMGFSGTGMMNNGSSNSWGRTTNGMMGNSYGIFGLLTWVALLIFLISGSIFFVKEILNKKSR